jgi:hypothetical protein
MDIEQIITRLESDDDKPAIDELQAAQTELTDAQEVLREQIKSGSLPYSELRERKAEFDAITDALSKVSEAHATAQAEIDAIIAEVGDTATPVDDDDADDADDAADETAKAEPVAASIRPVGQTLARIKSSAPRIEVNETDLTRVGTTYELLGKERETVTPAEVGQAFANKARSFGGSKTTILNIKTELAPERTLSGDASANERKMLDLFGANPVVPMTAAGGCCSIPEPIYDQPMLGTLARPIRDAFDVIGASRGAVQAYPPICLPDEGADVWTCAQDEAVTDDPETWKSCVALECDDEEPTLVEPIYKCLTVGTFQERFAPEQWEAFIFQADKLAARRAEARLFNWLAQSATSVYGDTGIATGSTYANFIKTGIRLATAIRQDQRLGDARMVWVGPEMVYSAILEDSVTRRLNDADEIEILKAHVDGVLAGFGVTYVGSEDIADMGAFSYDGDFPAYPDDLPTVMIPAGAAKVLDGGDKNLGVDVVDFDLARQNRVGAFSEFWEGLLVRNCNVAFANVAVEDCTTIACIGA